MGLVIGVGATRPKFPYDYYYGVEWDTTSSTSAVTRIGKMELHRELPIQSRMRRCLLLDDGTVNYYLHPNDSTLRDNGAAAVLDGTDGQVMVELPDTYVRFEMDGTKNRAMISTEALPGFQLWGKDYVSAYEAAMNRATTTLSSVVNMSADYRGGGNNASWDGTFRTLLGRPVTKTSLTQFRTAARKRGDRWNCMTYRIHKKIYWLYVIEYANFNYQAAFNAELTADGYRQGGLGAGVTTIGSAIGSGEQHYGDPTEDWNTFNGYYPFVPCGHTNSLGNRTGNVEYCVQDDTTGKWEDQEVPSYRGIENPFGHIWQWTDGILVDAGEELTRLFVCDDPAHYASSLNDYYQYRGNLPRSEGYVKALILGEHGEMMPLSVGGGSTAYMCDYFYTNVATSKGLRGVLVGGSALTGAQAGFASAYTNNAPSHSSANIGSRLCYSALEAANAA